MAVHKILQKSKQSISLNLLVQSQQRKHKKKRAKSIQSNNKETRASSLTSLWYLYC